MSERHDAHGYWLAEAGPAEPAPALEGQRSADVVVVGGGYTGLWTAWQVKQLQPEASVVVLEQEGCGVGPSGRNGGFLNGLWFSLPTLRKHFGDREAIAVAQGGPALGDRDRRLLPRPAGRRLVPAGGIPAGLDGARMGSGLGAGDGGLPRARRARRLRSARPRAGAAAMRLADLPRRRLLQGRGDRAAGAAGAGAGAAGSRARGRGLRAQRGDLGRAPRRRRGRRDEARQRAGQGRGDGRRRRPRAAARDAPPPHSDLEPHRDHRAGPGPARADRLDRGRVHNRLAGDGPLLPHHPGRPDRLRLGRGKGRLRAPARTAVPSATRR